ncbi:FAD-dependent oxidoreductase [Oceanobacillus sp. FSL K6-2867]|uniref:FAD-dependent oxidoreductase n=1 Tax=Oceanobacillus sp. FSL K6-2867 TaxID=2954748 RepID=UPI0030DB22CC
MEHFDAIIIGFGKGGKTLAASLAKAGKQVAMIEQSAEQYGGTCINIACIPTKSLAFQSEQQAKSGESKEDYYQEAIQEKDQLTSTLRENNFKMLDDQETVTVYTAKATFIDDKKIRLRSDSESLELTADNFFINTGSSPIIPPLDGIDDTENVYTSTTLQERHELPEKLVIIGGGYIGLEFASMYANFGSKVTVIDSSEEFLPNDDRDIADKVQKIFEEKGITLQLESRVKSVKNKDGGVAVTYQRGDTAKEITGSALLVATGRKPNTEGLGIENTSVQMDDKGAIITDDYLKTNADHIWALGDVNGGPQFTYISLDDFRIVRDQLFDDGSYSKKQRKNIPYSVFIEPVLSHVGLNEKTAKEEGINYRAASIPAAGVPYARIVKQTDGLLKALIDPDTDEILGCTLFCAGSHELINTVRIAMEAKLPYTRLKDNIFTHPSMSEALNNLFSSFD